MAASARTWMTFLAGPDLPKRVVSTCIVAVVTMLIPMVQPVPLANAAETTATTALRTARSSDFGPRAAAPSDVAVTGVGAADGYHVRIASGSAGYGWRDVAILKPAGLDPSTWYGYECLTDDGEYVAVAVLPADEINDDVSRDRGAYAYSVDVADGKVVPLASGVGLKYHSPGCGVGDTAAFTANLGSDESSTEALSFDLRTGAKQQDSILSGQVTSVVPTSTGLVGAQEDSIVSVPAGGTPSKPERATKLAAAGGDAYELRPSADGGVDFLARDPRSSTTTIQHLHGRSVHSAGSGKTSSVALFAGAGGHNNVVGGTVAGAGLTARDTTALPLGAETMSLDGRAAFGAKRASGNGRSGAAPSTQTKAAAEAELPLVESEVTRQVFTASGASIPQGTDSSSGATGSGSSDAPTTTTGSRSAAGADRRSPDVQPAPHEASVPRARTSAFSRTGDATLSAEDALATRSAVVVRPAVSSNAATPKCSIPRLQPNLEAMQPSNAQVNWATQMDEQGLLSGSSYTRPANFANMGLAAYAPSSDFPPVALSHPAGSSQTTVPRSVMLAIEAQESNFNQASWHALPGIAGDPLIADYYGVVDSISTIDYPNADCGYGIAQVTTGMAATDTSISTHGQMKIAVDYQENIAAGLQILEKTWNSLYADGITANGGDPKYLENWYFAAWAYNTGIQPNAAFGNTSGCNPSASCTGPDGTWGVGWSNNPQNPDYDPARAPYLKSSYADAAHPSSWPYQERIMGWMASPILRYGYYGYNTPTYNGGSSWLQIPPFSSFCDSSDDCNPGATAKQYCSLSDSECWWHKPVTWVAACATTCATSAYEYASGSVEPTYTAKYVPTCNQDGSIVPPGSVIVDDLPVPSQDDQGCAGMNWSDNGSFTYSPGTNSSGDPVGDIDTHQLGSGFGGHVFFSHTEPASATSIINTGTWTPNLPSRQYYKVKVHLPASGATAPDVVYTINPGGGAAPWHIRVNQAWGSEQWVTIGTFGMQNGGSVVLTNASAATPEEFDVAYDAVAFVPMGGDASTPIGGPPGIQDAPEGSNPAWVNCGCVSRTAGDPVDTATGSFSEDVTDATTPGLGLALRVSRSYSSVLADPTGPLGASGAVNGAFGHGWTWDYGMTTSTDSAGDVSVHQEDGSQVVFDVDASGAYAPTAPRYAATLVKTGSSFVFTRRGQDQFVFDTTTGRLTSESDPAGRAATPTYSTVLTYDSTGHLAKVTDPGGRSDTFTWTGSHVTAVVTPSGQEVDYAYSAAGDLTDVHGVGTTRSGTTLGDQDHTQYGYSANHLLLTERSPDAYGKTTTPSPVTTNTYDSSDRVTGQTDPDGDASRFVYGPDSATGITAGQTLVTSPDGNETLYTYTNDLLTAETQAYGTSAAATTTYQYDPATLGVLVQTNPDGTTETFGYDDQGDRTSSSDALGRTTASRYDAAGRILQSIAPSGLTTQYAYNAAGAVTSQSVGRTGQSAESSNDTLDPTFSRSVSFGYADAAHPGLPSTETDPDGNATAYSYDKYGDLATVKDAAGEQTDYGYDTTTSRRTSTVTPVGVASGTSTTCTPPATGCSTAAYDAWGHLVKQTDQLGHSTATKYDADGNEVSQTDADGHTTTMTYDAADRLLATTDPSGSRTSESYDADGNQTKYTDADGASTVDTFNAVDLLATATNPDGKTTAYTYDSAGRPKTVTSPDGSVSTNTYDAAGELTRRAYSDSTPSASYVYDSDGDRLSMTDGTGVSSYAYDAFDELTSTTDGNGATTGYSYDAAGNTTSVRYPGAGAPTVTRHFNAAERLDSIVDPSGKKTTFAYNADGAPTATGFGNGDVSTVAYDAADRASSSTLTQGSTKLGVVSYTRDPDGDVTAQTPSSGAPGPGTTYSYTVDQRLAGSTASATTKYAYDAAGNPTGIGASSQSFDAAGELCWTSASSVTSPTCSAAPSGATTYGYDADGRRTTETPASGPATSFRYNAAGELQAVSGSSTAAYTYDGDALRASKTVGGTTSQFTWDARSSVPALVSDGTNDYVYGPSGQVVEQYAVSSGSATYLFQDAHGSTVQLTGSTGAVTGSYAYNAWGTVQSHSGTASTPFQFAGAFADAETGLLYLLGRYYDTVTQLFLTVDPLAQDSTDAYRYADDDPLNRFDPMGLWSWAATWMVVGAVGLTAVGVGLAATGIGLAAEPFIAAGDEALIGGAVAEAGVAAGEAVGEGLAEGAVEAGAEETAEDGATEGIEQAAGRSGSKATRVKAITGRISTWTDRVGTAADAASCIGNHDALACVALAFDGAGFAVKGVAAAAGASEVTKEGLDLFTSLGFGIPTFLLGIKGEADSIEEFEEECSKG